MEKDNYTKKRGPVAKNSDTVVVTMRMDRERYEKMQAAFPRKVTEITESLWETHLQTLNK